MTRFAAPIAEEIWDKKYRLKEADGTPIDLSITGTWDRIATALSMAEKPEEQAHWAKTFYDALEDFKFIPAGRIVAGAGSGRNVTLSNCFGMGTISDDMAGIFTALQEAALTMQQGGGIGHDFSTLRPKGALVKGVAADASGPLSFMDCWDSMCRTIMSAGSRRGAMMGTMRVDHPDIEDFIEAKRDKTRLRMFNLSVLITDDFMDAVKGQRDFDLTFGGKVYKTIYAPDLWDRIMESTYAFAEPGVIFIDRINKTNPLNYAEKISVTNPCGEQPLPPYGACLLGSVNLTKFIKNPFSDKAKTDWVALKKIVRTAVRMMDNVIEVSNYPLPQQLEEAKNKRRIGLGVTGLADALIMLGIEYGSPGAVIWTEAVMRNIAHDAYLASADLAEEKGAFPLFDKGEYLDHPYVQQFDPDVQDAIAAKGLRNSHLTSIAPTGTISLMAGNVSGGIEPIFAYSYTRKVLQKDGSKTEQVVQDYAFKLWCEQHGAEVDLPSYFTSAQTLAPGAHVKMQAAAQKWVDASISKTVNVPEDISFGDFKAVYMMAYDMGCKGCTTYRPNDITGSVLSVEPSKPAEPVKVPEPTHVTIVTDERGMMSTVPVHPAQPSVPAERAEAMSGSTYKLKWPGSDHALYITINDGADGQPFEIFFNSKDVEHFAWMTALSRMISAVFRRGGDTAFVASELKQVFDPKGGAWVKGKFIPSLIAAIGGIVEKHMTSRDEHQTRYREDVLKPIGSGLYEVPDLTKQSKPYTPGERQAKAQRPCPSCFSTNTKNESGCFQCLDCGHSKCG